MTCVKQRVVCRIETESGEVVTGENWCRNPQQTCPRAGFPSGEGYHLCREICDQVGHAEQVAVMNLRGRMPVRAVIEGHTYVCDDCEKALTEAGVQEIHVCDNNQELI